MRNNDLLTLRKQLPYKYAQILEKKYAGNKNPLERWKRTTIYKVAIGNRRNEKILMDLYKLAKEHQDYLKKLSRFDKRLKKKLL